MPTAREWISNKWFGLVHGKNLVYNTCWEDPRLDRVALDLGPDDEVMVITSAGCNALDYTLCSPKAVHAVDMNPRQNALLELKIAAIRGLNYSQFFSMFGQGRLPDYQSVYWDALRPELSPAARAYWDTYIRFFAGTGWRRSFYFHGTSGTLARIVNVYIDRVAKVRPAINQILAAKTVEEQKEIYDRSLDRKFWNRFVRWAVGRDTTLSFLGVPRAQREHLDRTYIGGITQFIEDCIETVFTRLPLQDNYFWRVYLTGEYTPECCPEYVKQENFEKLKGGLVDRLHVYTASVLDCLKTEQLTISRFVLLDHMDWLSSHRFPILEAEWQAIIEQSAPKTRILWRSGGLQTDYVNRVRVTVDGKPRQVGEILNYNKALVEELHPKDRVHTYGSFFVADLNLR